MDNSGYGGVRDEHRDQCLSQKVLLVVQVLPLVDHLEPGTDDAGAGHQEEVAQVLVLLYVGGVGGEGGVDVPEAVTDVVPAEDLLQSVLLDDRGWILEQGFGLLGWGFYSGLDELVVFWSQSLLLGGWLDLLLLLPLGLLHALHDVADELFLLVLALPCGFGFAVLLRNLGVLPDEAVEPVLHRMLSPLPDTLGD